jgi:acetolactate synthase-1/2/3 large subunit
MHGEVRVNRALQRCDALLSVGARFDDRVTGRADRFAPQAAVIHLDIEPAQIGKTVRAAVELQGDARDLLGRLTRATPPGEHTEWRARLAAETGTRRSGANRGHAFDATAFPPAAVYRALDAYLRVRAGVRIVTDVGQHQMWAAQHLTWRRPGIQITSGGAGTMGFAVPAALGAALARPDETIWVIVGDGGFQMTNQELATIVQEGVRNVKIAIVNNGYLGMVRQWQELFHDRRYSGSPLSGPDFAMLGRAYGLHTIVVEQPAGVEDAIASADARPETVLLDFRVEREANVFPMVTPGGAIDAMLESEAVAS